MRAESYSMVSRLSDRAMDGLFWLGIALIPLGLVLFIVSALWK